MPAHDIGNDRPGKQIGKTVETFTLGDVSKAVDAYPLPEIPPEQLAPLVRMRETHHREMADLREKYAIMKERLLGVFRELQDARREGSLLVWLRSIFFVALGYVVNATTSVGETPDFKRLIKGTNLAMSIVAALAFVGWMISVSQQRSESRSLQSRVDEVIRL